MRGIASVVYLFSSESVARRLAGLNVALTQDWPNWGNWDGAFQGRLPHSAGTRQAMSQRLPRRSPLDCRWGWAEPSVWDLWVVYVATRHTRQGSLPVPLEYGRSPFLPPSSPCRRRRPLIPSPTDLLCEDVVLGMLRGQGQCGGRGMREARVLMDRDGDSLKTFDPGPLQKEKKKRTLVPLAPTGL